MKLGRASNSILDVLIDLESSQDLDTLKFIVRAAVQPYGYDRILMFSISAARDDLLDGIYWLEGSWFDEGEALDAETYVRHCPVTRHVLETDQPFFWTKTPSVKGAQYRFVSLPRGRGLHGLQIPIFGRVGLIGAVSFGGEEIESTAKVRLALNQVGTTAFLVARGLLEAPDSRINTKLSARELEVLRWIASGLRVAEIAATLGLSERTVENHLRRIRQRLRVRTTAEAITAALRSGAIPS